MFKLLKNNLFLKIPSCDIYATLQTLKELTENLYRIRTNAEALGRTDIVSIADPYIRNIAQSASSSKIPISIDTPEKFALYVDLVKDAIKFLGGIYQMAIDNPESIRQLFAGYRKLQCHIPNSEFENFTDYVEPEILKILNQ